MTDTPDTTAGLEDIVQQKIDLKSLTCLDCTALVRTLTLMRRNITLSAEERLIQAARQKAASEGTSLNHLFRTWISEYARPQADADNYAKLMARMGDVAPGGTFSRDEMNER